MDTIKRGVPLKIDNDGIVDSIVILRFETEFNHKKLEHELVSFLNEELTNKQFFSTPRRIKDAKNLHAYVEEGFFYSNGILKVLIDDDKFVINCLDTYPGWKNVLGKFVYGVIKIFHSRLVNFTYVGVRYINMFKNESLIENLDGEIRFNNFNIFNGSTYNFTCDAFDGTTHHAKVAVHLTEKAKYEEGFASIVDIEVNSNLGKFEINNADDVYSHVAYCHNVMKDIFYRLLSDKYVDSHNPIWS